MASLYTHSKNSESVTSHISTCLHFFIDCRGVKWLVFWSEFVIMEVINTTKGKPLAHYLGYAYRKHRENAEGIISWLCLKQKSKRCKGRLKSKNEIVLEVTDHQCGAPDEASLDVKKQICKVGNNNALF